MGVVRTENVGESQLSGSAGILGTGSFQVFPDGVLANPSQKDGLMVEFLASDVGEVSATLIIESNDPYQPLLEIELMGEGVSEQGGQDSETGGASGSIRTCGCSTSINAGIPWLCVGFGLVAISRRRM